MVFEIFFRGLYRTLRFYASVGRRVKSQYSLFHSQLARISANPSGLVASPWSGKHRETYCGSTKSCTTLQPWEAVVGIYKGIEPFGVC